MSPSPAPLDPVVLLQQLVAIPSVNPAMATGAGPPSECGATALCGEKPLTDWLTEFCAARGWLWLRQQVESDRDNLLVLLPGNAATAQLWDVHQDTVSIDGMSASPWGGPVQSDRVWGRGACDVKGSMAAVLVAADRRAQLPSEDQPAIILSFTINEECGFTGAASLIRLWSHDAASCSIRSQSTLSLEKLASCPPQRIVVCEPTELDVVVAHRGALRWRIETLGRAMHSSQPDQGANAVYAMTRVIEAVRQFHRETLSQRPCDAYCGGPTACVTTIAGGRGPNTVPDHAIIDVDRRLIPGETPEEAYGELTSFIDQRLQDADLDGCRVVHQRPWIASRGLEAGENAAWAQRVSEAAQRHGAEGRVAGVPYGTNASLLAQLKKPVVVCGPGSIAQAHTSDEWIAVDQLRRAADVFETLMRGAD
ncbi:MAG: M20/M25/M40 family metallo-hydrolase [Planctomycetales bacterium]|nr:M20/M25/M40 family metallo-hydrolase [Planctomycetales bacterium]